MLIQRNNILICGGTSSGKETLANLLTDFIPGHERIVLIEDTAEIQIHKENVLRFEARREQNGFPAVTIRDLLKATLRHRPDRIIVGEIRGGEAFDLLQLLNTGHSGTILNRSRQFRCPGNLEVHNVCFTRAVSKCHTGLSRQNIADSLNVIVRIDEEARTTNSFRSPQNTRV